MSGNTAFTTSGLDSLRGGTLSDPLTPGLSIEVLARGKKKWRYERRLDGGDGKVKMALGLYPAHGIAAARECDLPPRGIANQSIGTIFSPNLVWRSHGS